ncbi:predicted protein [Histoplasma capsulatum var. duboisii H88]|uniref:Predicted protein n=1 Tax=Ajellomyces capsulatus (strain H88) TaxID=544711 RepID=F0UH95_AJEC8|nr:predicted protein [Histoplasma capsulatum var. duboisii H88]
MGLSLHRIKGKSRELGFSARCFQGIFRNKCGARSASNFDQGCKDFDQVWSCLKSETLEICDWLRSLFSLLLGRANFSRGRKMDCAPVMSLSDLEVCVGGIGLDGSTPIGWRWWELSAFAPGALRLGIFAFSAQVLDTFGFHFSDGTKRCRWRIGGASLIES